MTRINMEFTQNVCYQAMGHLLESIREETNRTPGVWRLGNHLSGAESAAGASYQDQLV